MLVTKNPVDFVALHEEWLAANRTHAGIFLIYQDNDVKRDMINSDIVRAVNNVEDAHGAGGLANQVFNLNQYQW